jgi:hypothetical protein
LIVMTFPFTIILGFLSKGGEIMISLGSRVCCINSEKRIVTLSLLKLRDLLGGSADLSRGGRLSRLPPVGGLSSAQEETMSMPAGMNFGPISTIAKRIKASNSNESVMNRDFPGVLSTILFIGSRDGSRPAPTNDYLPMCTISTAISDGETPLIRCAWPRDEGLILASF